MNEKGEIEEPFTQETRNYKMIDQRKIDLEKIHYQKKHARINKKPSFFYKVLAQKMRFNFIWT